VLVVPVVVVLRREARRKWTRTRTRTLLFMTTNRIRKWSFCLLLLKFIAHFPDEGRK